MKLGAHCVLYGVEIGENTEAVIERLSGVGAEGCELGERFFGLDGREMLTEVLNRHHMALAGMHCANLKLMDLLNEPEKSRATLEKVARFMAEMPEKNVIATGICDEFEALNESSVGEGSTHPELHDSACVEKIAHNLNEIVRDIRNQYGVQVHYHNHSWEFADNGLIWFALAEHAPDVTFALDTGWAAASGFDPVELLDRYPGRFHYVHLRDYQEVENPGALAFKEMHTGFVALGTGSMNYPRLMRKLHQMLGADDWAIVEYELGNFDQNSYLSALSYLRGIREML